LRWNLSGALWTAAAALLLYAAISVAAGETPLVDDRFIIRCVQLTVIAAMVGYLTAYYTRVQREVLGLAAWPHRMPRDARDVVAEVLERATDILVAPRVLLIWEEPDEGYLNVAWRADGHVEWTHEPPGAYAPIVAEALERESFQALDVADPGARIRLWSQGRFRERQGASIHPALRDRFAMRAVQSCRLDGDIVHGRLFWLHGRAMRLDDLVIGELIALLAAARLDAVYFLARSRDSAGLRERLRVARDLHDSMLQRLAASGLQLAVARRLLGRDPDGTGKRLEDIQNQFERVEIDMRSFIRRLRPFPAEGAMRPAERLEDRCEALQRRVETQWGLPVDMRLSIVDRKIPDDLTEQVFLIVQEAVLNAARHAQASSIRVNIHAVDENLHIEIVDDGRGFPFSGSYDLAALNAMGRGPLTLRERVAELGGGLQLDSSQTGVRVVVTLPLAPVVA
jgi:signal transduction histidine kinase